MKSIEKIQHLKNLIQKKLTPLIDGDYVLLDLPYHNNVGDSLIWQGEEDFLKTLPYKCLFKSGIRDVSHVKKYVKSDTIILCHGGGNFGDIWPNHQNFRKKIIETFSDHKIIVLPQTIEYKNNLNLENDCIFFNQNSNVVLCLRDNRSFEFAKRNFPNSNCFLVPDMAFYMDVTKFVKPPLQKGTKLFLKRNDQELNTSLDYSLIPQDSDEKDWLSQQNHNKFLWKNRFVYRSSILDQKLQTSFSQKINDYFWNRYLRKIQVQEAIDVLSCYEIVYTTRMHAVILSVLLGKKNVYYFDNSYGKTSSLVETWFSDLDSVSNATRM